MKQRILSFPFFAVAVVWLAWLPPASGQSAAAAESHGSAAPATIPAELSVEARAQYEAQMKTLRAQVEAAKWQEALATAEAMNKERPREPQARFLKTIVLTELGRDDDAQRELQALVTEYPELPEPHNNLAALYAKKGEYDSARRELEQALTAVPDYGVAHANLADLYLQQAIEHYRRAAALIKNGRDSRGLSTRAEAIQMLLTPTAPAGKTATAKNDAAAKDEKAAAKDEKAAAKNEKAAAKDAKATAKEDDFLSGDCKAPPGYGGEGGDQDGDVFDANGTCGIDFDEPAPEKKKSEDGKAPPAKTP